jgi:uncharacterized membrane protein YidH (DUF202 family)
MRPSSSARAGDQRSPERQRDDPGLALERTALAWTRTSLALVANAALLLRLGIEANAPILGCAGAAVVAIAAGAARSHGTFLSGRSGNTGSARGHRPLRAIAAATTLTAALGTILALFFAWPR